MNTVVLTSATYVSLIKSHDERIFINDVLAIPHHCFLNALYNKQNAYANKELKIVIGSLGIGKKDPFYEYGNPHWSKVEDFRKAPGMYDIHVWLEDIDGNIYDVVITVIHYVAVIKNKSISFKDNEIIAGKSREQCERAGLFYVEASKEISHAVLQEYIELNQTMLQLLNI